MESGSLTEPLAAPGETAPLNEPQHQQQSEIPELYDTDTVLVGSLEVLRGHLVLLNAEEPLPFTALTDGNVVDFCFGVQDSSNTKQRANRTLRARHAKAFLAGYIEPDERRMAVQAYSAMLNAVAEYQDFRAGGSCCFLCSESAAQANCRAVIVAAFRDIK